MTALDCGIVTLPLHIRRRTDSQSFDKISTGLLEPQTLRLWRPTVELLLRKFVYQRYGGCDETGLACEVAVHAIWASHISRIPVERKQV
jgi:hypothetical protein